MKNKIRITTSPNITIVHADQIFVLQGGRIVQSGTYDMLVSQPGPFRELAKRQFA